MRKNHVLPITIVDLFEIHYGVYTFQENEKNVQAIYVLIRRISIVILMLKANANH